MIEILKGDVGGERDKGIGGEMVGMGIMEKDTRILPIGGSFGEKPSFMECLFGVGTESKSWEIEASL